MLNERKIDSIGKIKDLILSDKFGHDFLFCAVNGAIALVALIMTCINLATGEKVLMVITLVFALLCIVNLTLYGRSGINKKAVHVVFGIESFIILAFFIVSGIPDGFSVLWICLVPSFSMFVFGTREGCMYSLGMFAMIVFLFWVPAGEQVLMYSYSDTFTMRFPFLYFAVLLVSAIAEWSREETKKRLENSIDKYYYLYRHDALTGVFNRFGIREYISKIFENNNNLPISVILLDIDDFKSINDRYGHDCGDKVLRMIAEIPRGIICEHCQISRWGGEEFLMIMQCECDAAVIAEEIRKEIENTNVIYQNSEIPVTVSVGVCVSGNSGKSDIENVIIAADRALYEAKNNGKNRICVRCMNQVV